MENKGQFWTVIVIIAIVVVGALVWWGWSSAPASPSTPTTSQVSSSQGQPVASTQPPSAAEVAASVGITPDTSVDQDLISIDTQLQTLDAANVSANQTQ